MTLIQLITRSTIGRPRYRLQSLLPDPRMPANFFNKFAELAVGVYQPNHVRPGVILSNDKPENDNPECEDNNPEHWRKLNSAHGEIFKFRVSLWREHLNRLEPVLADPWTEECAK